MEHNEMATIDEQINPHQDDWAQWIIISLFIHIRKYQSSNHDMQDGEN